jgi:hypothetical protein
MVNKRELSLEAAANLKSLTRRDDITVKPASKGNHDVDINIGGIKMSGEIKSFVTKANLPTANKRNDKKSKFASENLIV